MYCDTLIVEHADGFREHAGRLPIGDTMGRDEAWLRDHLFASPETIPIADLDPSFGPLVPLCKELRTEAGPIDIAFINGDGLLTLVECKLWRNPEARRKVVARVLHYASAIRRWSYADLQRQVSMATRTQGNVPFQLVLAKQPNIEEYRFIDATTRAMRSGRFQLLIAGDGIREDIAALAELINRKAASAFSLGMMEVALYALGDSLVIQPRIIARTTNIERSVVVVRSGTEVLGIDEPQDEEDDIEPSRSSASAERGFWWGTLNGLTFDDPEQQPARFVWPNNLYTPLPTPGLWLSAYRSTKRGGECGVYLGGRKAAVREVTRRLIEEGVLEELPKGTVEGSESYGLIITRPESAFSSVADEQRWLAETLKQFTNAIRPPLKRLKSSAVS